MGRAGPGDPRRGRLRLLPSLPDDDAQLSEDHGIPAARSHPAGGRWGGSPPESDGVSRHVALLDEDGVIVSTNSSWHDLNLFRGAGARSGLGLNFLTVCETAADSGDDAAAQLAQLVRQALAGRREDRQLMYCDDQPTARRWFRVLVTPVQGQHGGALVMHEETTAERRRQAELRRLAFFDNLTGVYNRGQLCARLEQAISSAERDSSSLAVLFLDVDRFKDVNDRLGHAAGDQVLIEVSRRLNAVVRDADTFGRWGGDEFLVVAERLQHSNALEQLVGRLHAVMATPVPIASGQLALTVSVGVARWTPGKTADDVVAEADLNLRLHGKRTSPS